MVVVAVVAVAMALAVVVALVGVVVAVEVAAGAVVGERVGRDGGEAVLFEGMREALKCGGLRQQHKKKRNGVGEYKGKVVRGRVKKRGRDAENKKNTHVEAVLVELVDGGARGLGGQGLLGIGGPLDLAGSFDARGARGAAGGAVCACGGQSGRARGRGRERVGWVERCADAQGRGRWQGVHGAGYRGGGGIKRVSLSGHSQGIFEWQRRYQKKPEKGGRYKRRTEERKRQKGGRGREKEGTMWRWYGGEGAYGGMGPVI